MIACREQGRALETLSRAFSAGAEGGVAVQQG